jgi:hypothetical protein
MKTKNEYKIEILLPVNVSFNFDQQINSYIKMHLGPNVGKSILFEQAINLYSDIKFNNGVMDYDKAVKIAELWKNNCHWFTLPIKPESKLPYLTIDYSPCPFDGNNRIKIYGNNDLKHVNEEITEPTLLLVIKF